MKVLQRIHLTTTKDPPDGSKRQGDQNNHLSHPDKQKCEFNYPNLTEIQQDKSNDYISVPDHNNNAGQVSPQCENNSGQSAEGNFTTGIGHESDTINRVSGQSWENVNKGFLSLKNRTPCPFLLR